MHVFMKLKDSTCATMEASINLGSLLQDFEEEKENDNKEQEINMKNNHTASRLLLRPRLRSCSADNLDVDETQSVADDHKQNEREQCEECKHRDEAFVGIAKDVALMREVSNSNKIHCKVAFFALVGGDH